MFVQRLILIALAVIACLASAGCQPATQPSAGDLRSPMLSQKDADPPQARAKAADENTIFVRLLMSDSVQTELALSADQMERIKDFIKISGEQQREFIEKSGYPGVDRTMTMSEEKINEFKAWIEALQSKQKESRAKLVEMLTRRQKTRLKQIRLQQAVAAFLTNPELVKELDISEEQLAKIRPLSKRNIEKRLEDMRGLRGLAPKEYHKKSIELSKQWEMDQAEANKLAMEVLSSGQRAKLEKLMGKKVEVIWDYDALIPEDCVM